MNRVNGDCRSGGVRDQRVPKVAFDSDAESVSRARQPDIYS
jgi:hypothetical protein